MDESQLAKETTSADGRRDSYYQSGVVKSVASGDIAAFGGLVPIFGR